MRSYEERLPLIDKAIDYYKGKLPREANPDATLIIVAFGSYYFISEEYFNTCGIESEFVCYEEEFEKRAKELGWINGYKFGVEYETNGKKPDLPDDVTIEIECIRGRRDLVARLVKYNNWDMTKSFRICDERFKPKEQVVNNNWYEKGEFPPVGEVVEVMPLWDKVVIVAHHEGKIVFFNERLNEYDFFCNSNKFRPIQSEHESLVNQARSLSYPMDVFHEPTARVMIDAGWRPTKEEK